MKDHEYTIDGANFRTLDEAASEFTARLGWTMPWDGNLDAFNDFLNGGFGTPEEGFILHWRHADLSKERLGYRETIKWLEERVRSCHPANTPEFQHRVTLARRSEGQTLFEMLVEIIRGHDDIDLRLDFGNEKTA